MQSAAQVSHRGRGVGAGLPASERADGKGKKGVNTLQGRAMATVGMVPSVMCHVTSFPSMTDCVYNSRPKR